MLKICIDFQGPGRHWRDRVPVFADDMPEPGCGVVGPKEDRLGGQAF